MEIKEVKALINFIAKSGLEEVHLATDQVKLTVKRNAPWAQPTAPLSPQAPSLPAATAPGESANENQHITVKAPMIGTYYQSPSPEAPPFVQVGDQIAKGQKLCIIEAMKLFNEIEADQAGTLVEILVEDGTPVEYDQPLFHIAPA